MDCGIQRCQRAWPGARKRTIVRRPATSSPSRSSSARPASASLSHLPTSASVTLRDVMAALHSSSMRTRMTRREAAVATITLLTVLTMTRQMEWATRAAPPQPSFPSAPSAALGPHMLLQPR